MASKRRNMFHKNKTQETTEKVAIIHELMKSENSELVSRLEVAESSCSELRSESEKVKEELLAEKEINRQLEDDLSSLKAKMKLEEDKAESELTDEKARNDKLSEELQKERKEKDDALLRNAQVSQEVDMAKQDLKQQQAESEEMYKKIGNLEDLIKEKDLELSKYKSEVAELIDKAQTEAEARQMATENERKLKETIGDLKAKIAEKDKDIRVLQQRRADLQKTLRDLKVSESSGDSIANHNASSGLPPKNNVDEDINFLYLKHVIIKFLTCREYEAPHLTKAIATLLKLTPDEESHLKETLDWRMSWFGARRPKLQNNHLNS
ncbi:hypothetical protein AAG570_001570 [Ranatra chinensis]|uniref:GRIP domain-containing protein n=1 Tax=Ranatra chinensis TaxID=642074 RepID=A0ABD0YAV6_9HEMI